MLISERINKLNKIISKELINIFINEFKKKINKKWKRHHIIHVLIKSEKFDTFLKTLQMALIFPFEES